MLLLLRSILLVCSLHSIALSLLGSAHGAWGGALRGTADGLRRCNRGSADRKQRLGRWLRCGLSGGGLLGGEGLVGGDGLLLDKLPIALLPARANARCKAPEIDPARSNTTSRKCLS
jgi:hypothetical protein